MSRLDTAGAGDVPQQLRNLTPHPLYVYPVDTPDVVDPDQVEPYLTIAPDGAVARLAMIDLGTQHEGIGVPVEYVEIGRYLVDRLPPPAPGQWLVVSLPVVLSDVGRGRPDLLVPYREVRNARGTVVGCRMLARPV